MTNYKYKVETMVGGILRTYTIISVRPVSWSDAGIYAFDKVDPNGNLITIKTFPTKSTIVELLSKGEQEEKEMEFDEN